jgi:hypothetical protein
MEPLVRALAQPSDEEQLVNAAIGFLVAAPMAYRAVYVKWIFTRAWTGCSAAVFD